MNKLRFFLQLLLSVNLLPSPFGEGLRVSLMAQDVMVTVAPVQQVLPPQAFLYVADPGRYFNITLTNLTDEAVPVYLGFQLEQTNPSSDLSISTPPSRQPQKPYTISPKGVYQLSLVEMKEMFNHLSLSEIQAPQNLFSDYVGGSFGLLPEGLYTARITAYYWHQPAYATPQPASGAEDGQCHFTICYRAQAPYFLTPASVGGAGDEMGVVSLDALSPEFTWAAPVVACNPSASQYEYTMRIVELLPRQDAATAIERNPTVYLKSGLVSPICRIPIEVLSTMNPAATYVARVQAFSRNSAGGLLGYTEIENGGKSDLKVFRIKTSEPDQPVPRDDAEQGEEDDADGKGIFGSVSHEAFLNPDSAYTYRLPRLLTPEFDSLTARKSFAYEDIRVSWEGVYHLGGEGQQPDTLVFSYQVQLYDGGAVVDRAAALAMAPIYTADILDDKDDVELKQLIPWDEIGQQISVGDYLVLRIQPRCMGSGVAFAEDSINVVDFTLAEHLAPKYFQCSSQVEITNREPTTRTAKELKDQVVSIGEYELTIDEIQGSGATGFKGRGRVEWRPLGFPAMVCVEFDKLLINTEDRVYEGKCVSYADDASSDMEGVDRLFSDWGIDNLIGDGQLPAAQYLQPSAMEGVKEIAKKINLSKYYSYIKTGKNTYDLLGKGKIERLYMPLALPRDINTSPVDIQIVGMTFAPDHATMNIMGEFTLPESDYLAGDILVLGAPRVCISPESILPEGGTVALLSDFTIKDPNSAFTMTFKAPKDLITPRDGCYVAWKDNRLEIFGIDMDMTIPGIVKDVGGQPSTEAAKLTVTASVESWDEFLVDRVSMDPFQVEDLPGWTFTAKDIVIDLAKKRNAEAMGAFPKGYDKKKAGIVGSDVVWQGMYINEISVQFPTALEIGTENDRRFKLSATDMFFDASGASLVLDADQMLDVAAEGRLGGWSFSLDNVGLSILQNNFKDCHFSGTFGVPLVEGKIGYSCQIQKLDKVDEASKTEGKEYAYIFKTQQVDNLNFDFFLAKAEMNKKQTYLLVESVPEKGKQKTRVELLMGGVMDIGGGSMLKDKNLDFRLPGIAFSQFRLANCKAWESEFEDVAKMQKEGQELLKEVKMNGKTVKVGYLISNKEYEIKKDVCYISRGTWGLASAQKTLGPFELTLNSFNVEYTNDLLKLCVDGKVTIVQGLDLSAQAKMTIQAEVKNTDDLARMSIAYKELELNDLVLKSTFAGCTFDGKLHQQTGENSGYTGEVKFALPGDFLIIEANAAYYDYDDGKGTAYTWGFLRAKIGSKTGIEITPIKILSITGGFYFNCRRDDNDEKGAKAEKGLIGVVLGIGLSTTAGESALKGDFEMTCVYDKYNNRLTSFVFNGHMEAVDGMIDADASIVYHHDNTDQYLALNVTVDAKVDASELAGSIQAQASTFKDQLDKLKEKAFPLVKDVKDGLDDKIGDTDGETEGHESDAQKPVEVKAGAEVSLDFRITMKEKGKKCTPVRWHLYLGNPESEQKRCRFTLIDFQSPVVSVNIGANAYLCVGNELPNNGKLPDIPYKVRQFLDGKSKGKGVQSASKGEADMARQKAMEEVLNQAASGCGVMLGATAYGYIDLDFGLLYGNFGATAGFDIALTKFKSPQWCSNYGSNMGFHDWYGNGQLYASLQADLGLRLNLGFFNDSISILKAGLGGCFKFQGPKPSYFTGEARCYLSLFNGLVDIDRTYEFECGTFCKAFHGNPLDDFELFGDCMGYESGGEGWNDEKKYVNARHIHNPILQTNAGIGQHFRLLDENELDRIEEKSGASRSQLEAQATRTFVFYLNSATLYKYTLDGYSEKWSDGYYGKTIKFRGNVSGVKHVLDLVDLDSNKKYRLSVRGYAKEIVGGQAVNPVTFNEKTHKYENKAWSQTKNYYFQTGPEEEIGDIVDLQEYVAIAYPSYYNQLKYDGEYINAHKRDVMRPLIALTDDLSGKVFQNGTFQWRWKAEDQKYSNTVPAFITTTLYADPKGPSDGYTACHVACSGAFNCSKGQKGQLTLEYIQTHYINDKYVSDTTTLAKLKLIIVDENDWQTSVMDYEKPFIGLVADKITPMAELQYFCSDESLVRGAKLKDGKTLCRLADAYWYIGYLSNLVFPGGYQMDSYRYKMYGTTSQTLIYSDKGGHYHGNLSKEPELHGRQMVSNTHDRIRNLSWYTYDQFKDITPYPLPYLSDHKYNYVRGGNNRVALFTPANNSKDRLANLLDDLRAPYYAAADLQGSVSRASQDLERSYNWGYSSGAWTKGVDEVVKWNNKYLGCMITAKSGSARMEMPYYQITIAWTATWGNGVFCNMYNMLPKLVDGKLDKHWRAETVNGNPMFYHLYGGKGYAKDKLVINVDNITELEARAYRVNAYDITKGVYFPMSHGNRLDYKVMGTTQRNYVVSQPLSDRCKVEKEF